MEFFVFITSKSKCYCTCGNSWDGGGRECLQCKTTENVKVFNLSRTVPYFETVDKTDTYFRLRRANLKLSIENEKLVTKVTTIQEVSYDLRVREAKMNVNGKITEVTEGKLKMFFSGREDTGFIDLVSTERSKPIYRFALKFLGKKHRERTHKFYRCLTRLKDYPAVDAFLVNGFKGSKNLLQLCKNVTPKAPHKILDVPKYSLPFIKDIFELRSASTAIKELCEHFNGNDVKKVLELWTEESDLRQLIYYKDTLINLYRDYDYKDIVKLVRYLVRDVKLEQGISSARASLTLLRDYARMMKDMNLTPEKYPKSLKKVHDIAQMNYRIMDDEITNRRFKDAVKRYEHLAYQKDEYTVIVPEKPSDLVDEGEALNHCVASYVKDVCGGKCNILFLRESANKEESLITIEVRNGNIRQARGRFNKNPLPKHQDFIKVWAKEKGLKVQYY